MVDNKKLEDSVTTKEIRRLVLNILNFTFTIEVIKTDKNMIADYLSRHNPSFYTCSFSPSSPSLNTSSVGGGVTALVLDGPGVCPLPLEDVLPRPLPRPLATVLPRATAPVAGSVVSCLSGVGVGVVVALVLTICERE